MSARSIDSQPAPPGMDRIHAFTLGTALAWLGHECSGGCPPESSQLRADAWHLSPSHPAHKKHPILVLVHFLDTSAASMPMHAMLRQVNHCTWSNRIRVREWHPTMAPLDGALAELGALIRDRNTM